MFPFSFRTTLCLRHEPNVIAAAGIYVGSKFIGEEIALTESKKSYFDILGVKKDVVLGMFHLQTGAITYI